MRRNGCEGGEEASGRGWSLRSLRPHIGMCSLNARGKGPLPAARWGEAGWGMQCRRALEVAAMSIYCHVATEMLRLSTPLGRGSRRRKEAMVWRLLCALRLHIGMRFLNARGKGNG